MKRRLHPAGLGKFYSKINSDKSSLKQIIASSSTDSFGITYALNPFGLNFLVRSSSCRRVGYAPCPQ